MRWTNALRWGGGHSAATAAYELRIRGMVTANPSSRGVVIDFIAEVVESSSLCLPINAVTLAVTVAVAFAFSHKRGRSTDYYQ